MCEVNLGDQESFRENLDLLESYQRDQYNQAFSNYKKMGNNVYRFQERYYQNAQFIIYAELPFSYEFCACGTKVNGMPGNCKKRMFCTCCSYTAGTDVWQRFRECFLGRTCYFVTFGFKGSLPWEHRDESRIYWHAANYALKKVLKKGDGAILSHEMHLRGMMPITLNPHSHAVLSLAGFSEAFELEQMLQDRVEKYFKNQKGFTLRQRPDVEVRLIEDIDDYQGSIRYLFKPIELKGEYDTATILHGTSPEVLTRLNSEMKDFLKWFTVERRMQKMHTYKGVFAGGENSIGLSVKDLKKSRRRERQERQTRAMKGVPTAERFQLIPALARGSRNADAEIEATE